MHFGRTITCDQMDALCTELAKTYIKDKKCDNEGAAKEEILTKLAAAEPKAHGTTVSACITTVFDSYTGHKKPLMKWLTFHF